MEVAITPYGLTLREEGSVKKAQFSGGDLVNPVKFSLRAGQRGSHPSGVLVTFSVNRSLLYEVYLAITVVEKIDLQAQQGQQVIEDLNLDDLDQAKKSRGRNLGVKLDVEDFCFTVTVVEDGEIKKGERSKYGPAEIGAELIRITEIVNEAAIKTIFDEAPYLEKDEKDANILRHLQHTLDVVATAGWQLYKFLSACPAFKGLLGAVEKLDPGSRIAIHTERCFLPWNILYPNEFNWKWERNGLPSANPRLFWGYRYHFETRLVGGIGETSRKFSDVGNPMLSVNVNPSLEEQLGKGPQPPFYTHEVFCSKIDGRYVEQFNKNSEAIEGVLIRKSTGAGLLYFYCHGKSEKPYQLGHSERLEFQDGFANFHPQDIPCEPQFKTSPVVFLNSCGSGAFSPLVFSNFLSQLKQVGAQGMIVTDFPVPTKIGGYIGQTILKDYVNGTPIGESLFTLRKRLLERLYPVGLFYSLQCSLDFHAAQTSDGQIRR